MYVCICILVACDYYLIHSCAQVRILDNEAATAAVTRVMIEFQDRILKTRWTTVIYIYIYIYAHVMLRVS